MNQRLYFPPICTWYYNTTPDTIHLCTKDRFLRQRLNWKGEIVSKKFQKIIDKKKFFFLLLSKKNIINYVYQVIKFADGCYLKRVPDNAVKRLFPYDEYNPPKSFAGSWLLPCGENPLDMIVCNTFQSS